MRKRNTRVTPEHRKDIEKRKERDIDFLIAAASFIVTLGILAQLMSSWKLIS